MPTQTNASVSNTGHTPGPWRWNSDPRDVSGSAAIYLAFDSERRAYYELIGAGRWIIANETTAADGLPVMIIREADARLIENAPRLLTAAKDLWHADAAEGSDRDGMRIVDAWAELIDAIEAADGSRPLDPDEPTVEDLKERFA